jgi:hypothetical protein
MLECLEKAELDRSEIERVVRNVEDLEKAESEKGRRKAGDLVIQERERGKERGEREEDGIREDLKSKIGRSDGSRAVRMFSKRIARIGLHHCSVSVKT